MHGHPVRIGTRGLPNHTDMRTAFACPVKDCIGMRGLPDRRGMRVLGLERLTVQLKLPPSVRILENRMRCTTTFTVIFG